MTFARFQLYGNNRAPGVEAFGWLDTKWSTQWE